MKMTELASRPNLELAWRRITTGGNAQYKRLFRNIYYAYEVALNANLRDLRQRLLGGSYKATCPERIYMPKASGLHRPLALLVIEDQIVLQAFANLAAKKVLVRRLPLQFKVIYSNILEKPNSIFFFRRWQQTFKAFQKQIEHHYREGMKWVGDFDLAAFYDTISHELLLRTIYPRTSNSDMEWMQQCLQTWSSENTASGHGHGLPQGPLASDFLAECFLLPIDLAMKNHRGYMRYVDDVRLFGATDYEVRANLIELERHCIERGLIPQSGKFEIKRANSVSDAMGMLPSIADPHHEDTSVEAIAGPLSLDLMRSAISGKPYRVVDKTRLRFVLFRAEPDSKVLRLVLRLIPHHPEHADVFFYYLRHFGFRKPIERMCLFLVRENPYPYVRGEAWHVLASYRSDPHSLTVTNPKITEKAIIVAKRTTKENFFERWGACHFLCASESATSFKYSRFLNYQTPLVQALTAPMLPESAFARGGAVPACLKRTTPEPGLSLCSLLNEKDLTPAMLGLDETKLQSQVVNTMRELGLVRISGSRVDPIAEVLFRRYGVPRGKSWHLLLDVEYVHALGLLKLAEATFKSGRSYWLACQNSFNQAIFLAIQRHFGFTGNSAACKILDKHGNLIDFGVTLESSGPFSRACPTIGKCFRDMNSRRNRLPASHPYEKRTAARSEHLKEQERNAFVAQLRTAYSDFVTLMP